MDLPQELQPVDEMTVPLSSGTVALPRCRPSFPMWNDVAPDFDFGSKPLLNLRNQSVFAELYILHLLTTAG